MGCDDVKRVIYFYLDGQLGDAKQRDLSDHLSLCPECDQRRKVHQRIRDFFRRRVARINATDRFKQRLTRSVRAISIEL